MTLYWQGMGLAFYTGQGWSIILARNRALYWHGMGLATVKGSDLYWQGMGLDTGSKVCDIISACFAILISTPQGAHINMASLAIPYGHPGNDASNFGIPFNHHFSGDLK